MSTAADQAAGSFDQNGNFCGPTKPKESVLQILSDTLGGNDAKEPVAYIPLKQDYTTVQVTPDPHSNSDPNFIPGDKICKPKDPKTRPKFRQCHLTTVVGSALRCLKQLDIVKQGLASLVSLRSQNSALKPENLLVALLGEYTMHLTRQVFTPAHRLYTTALGLHMSEDLIRNPTDPTLLNFRQGPIMRPDWNSIIHTQMKLRTCVDTATEMYHRFGREIANSGSALHNDKLQHLMVTLMHAFQDLYATALGSNDIFKVLLHIEDYGQEILQEYLLSLSSTERSDLLVQVQTLRRYFDDIVIMIEQLSWTSYAVSRVAYLSPQDSSVKLSSKDEPSCDENGNRIEERKRSRSKESLKSRPKPRPASGGYLDALQDGGTDDRRRSRRSKNSEESDSEDEKVRSKSSESGKHRKTLIPAPAKESNSPRKSSPTNLRGDDLKSSSKSRSDKKDDGSKSNNKSRRSRSRSSVSSHESSGSVNKSSKNEGRSETHRRRDSDKKSKA